MKPSMLMHNALLLARGYWFECISHSYAPPEMDCDRFDVSVEPYSNPLDAPDMLAAGSCYSAVDPFFNQPFTDMSSIPRWVPLVPSRICER
jgi:hypothetical protein